MTGSAVEPRVTDQAAEDVRGGRLTYDELSILEVQALRDLYDVVRAMAATDLSKPISGMTAYALGLSIGTISLIQEAANKVVEQTAAQVKQEVRDD